MDLQTVPVFFSTDHNYIIPTCVAVLSMLQNSTDCHCDIYFLIDNTVLDKDKDILSKTVKPYDADIYFISVGNEMDNGYAFRGISKACYYRLLIPWIVPHLKTAIYCDGDIIFTRSILNLYKIPINDKLIGAVHTPFYDSKKFVGYCKKLELDAENYVNSGILLINCSQMRHEGLKEQFQKHIGKKYYYQDQDIINIVCKEKIEYLPLEYNYPSYIFFNTTKLKPIIIHYSGPKPWKVFTNLWAYWWSIYDRSIVYNESFECEIYQKILIPDYSLKKVIRLYLRHLKNKLKKSLN